MTVVSTAPHAILQRMSNAENNHETTRPGGITGNGFKPGQSGNPGGRPKGVARTVRDACGGSPRVLPRSCWRSPRIRKRMIVIGLLRVGSCLTVGGARLLRSRLWRPAIRSRCPTSRARFRGSRMSCGRGGTREKPTPSTEAPAPGRSRATPSVRGQRRGRDRRTRTARTRRPGERERNLADRSEPGRRSKWRALLAKETTAVEET